MSVYHILSSLTSNVTEIMELLRIFVLQCLRINLTFSSAYTPSKSNCLTHFLEICFRSAKS